MYVSMYTGTQWSGPHKDMYSYSRSPIEIASNALYYVCMYVRMYVCMYVRMYVCTYICMYLRMYVCMYVLDVLCMYCTYVQYIGLIYTERNLLKLGWPSNITNVVYILTTQCTYVCIKTTQGTK